MKKSILIAAALLTSASFAFAEEKSNTLSWDRLLDLPDTEGFAGVFAGVLRGKRARKAGVRAAYQPGSTADP